VSINLVFLRGHQSTQALLPSFFPVLDLLVHVLPCFSLPWLSPICSVIASLTPPIYQLSVSFQPRSRDFAISPGPL
jgi:hypothetical protein